MKTQQVLFGLLGAVVIAGCAAPATSAPPVVPPKLKPTPVDPNAKLKFDNALVAFVKHDEARDWTAGSCTEVVALFDEAIAARNGQPFAQASFNAGIVHQRCGEDAKAKARFEKAVQEDAGFHAAKAKLALYRFKEDRNADAAIAVLEKAVSEGKFSDVSVLVDLAAMELVRGGNAAGIGCKDDLECAKLNLHRALAIDDAYMPAHNELALYYLQLAKRRASKQKHADVQQLELAALVCSQAIRKNPHYAPIHNTAGLIQYELGHVNNAVEAFGKAAEIDPKFYEAQMNYAAVNLGFRGFEQAQAAYKRAIAVRPNDYDAHLGLAVALRAPIIDEADEKAHQAKLAAVDAEIAATKRIDGNRPDAFFNEAIFIHEMKSTKESPAESIAALEQAEAKLNTFLEKARGKAGYDAAIKKANDRLADIAATKDFLKTSNNPKP